MNIIENKHPKSRLEYIHSVEHRGKKYTREEIIILNAFSWESTPNKLEDIHTITWKDFEDDENHVQYFSGDHGWSKNGKLDPSNPIPKLEQIFKQTIGKNLIYINTNINNEK